MKTIVQRVRNANVRVEGEIVVVWDSGASDGTDSSSFSVHGRRFAISLFADGFESGDPCRWSGSL